MPHSTSRSAASKLSGLLIMSLSLALIKSADSRIEQCGVGDPGCVRNKSIGGRAINFSGRFDVGKNHTLQRNGVSQGERWTLFPKKEPRPFRVGGKLRNPQTQRMCALAGRRGAPDTPSRPRHHGVKRCPNYRTYFLRRRKARFVEAAVPRCTAFLAAVTGPIPCGPGGCQSEASEREQRASIPFRHSAP